jgi:hypothetical protein
VTAMPTSARSAAVDRPSRQSVRAAFVAIVVSPSNLWC